MTFDVYPDLLKEGRPDNGNTPQAVFEAVVAQFIYFPYSVACRQRRLSCMMPLSVG